MTFKVSDNQYGWPSPHFCDSLSFNVFDVWTVVRCVFPTRIWWNYSFELTPCAPPVSSTVRGLSMKTSCANIHCHRHQLFIPHNRRSVHTELLSSTATSLKKFIFWVILYTLRKKWLHGPSTVPGCISVIGFCSCWLLHRWVQLYMVVKQLHRSMFIHCEA